MKAEDTVVKADELCRLVCSEYVTRFFERKDCAGLDCEDCSLEAQAKITFKAATEAERKEMGQFLRGRGMAGQDGSYPHFVRVEMSEIEALSRGIRLGIKEGR